jgi:replicative DNA helicase
LSNPSAEALLISALINTGDALAATRYGITPEHFSGYAHEYSWLIQFERDYHETPTVDEFCDRYPDFPFKQHSEIRYAADEVRDNFFQRKAIETITEANEALRRGQVGEAYATLRRYEYSRTSATPTSFKDASFLDTWDEPLRGIEVPYPTLQRHTGGIRPGNLWYLAARLGQGKSAYLIDIATNAMMSGANVLYYSLEMTDHELRSRQHSILARKFGYPDFQTTELLRREIDLASYKKFMIEVEERVPGDMHIHTPADGPVSPATIASRADEYDLVVVDYATLMVTDSGEHASTDWRTATQISNRLKQVALAHNVPILAAAQINRDGEVGDLPPKIKNLAQADALGQDGDVVITMRARAKNVASIFSLEKNRHGASGMRWWTVFDVNNGVFAEISEDKAEQMVLDATLEEQQ